MANNNRLGELLVREKLISLPQLRHAQDEQQKSGNNLGYTLAKLGYICDDEITNFLSPAVPRPDDQPRRVRDRRRRPEARPARSRARSTRSSRSRAPARRSSSRWRDPTNLNAIDDLKFLTGYNVEPVVASETAIHAAIEKYYNAGPSYDEVMAGFDETEIDFTGDEDDDQPPRAREGQRGRAGRPPRQHDAAQRHQEGRERHPHRAVREEAPRALPHRRRAARGDDAAAQAQERDRQPHQDHEPRSTSPSAASRKTDASSSSSARAGRWTSASRCCPTLWGEKIVMRLLDKGNLQLDMTKLGFDPKPLDDFKWAINQPWGMVLVTGPDGLGQDDDALLGAQRAQQGRRTTSAPPKIRSSTTCTASTRCRCTTRSASTSRWRLRVVPAAGPGHHHGRRDPRLRDRGDRGQGGAHGPLGALDAAHQRRARDDLAPPQHGRRAVPHHGEREPRARAAPRAQDLRRLQAARRVSRRKVLEDMRLHDEQIANGASS